jgi:hypothetical protein
MRMMATPLRIHTRVTGIIRPIIRTSRVTMSRTSLRFTEAEIRPIS